MIDRCESVGRFGYHQSASRKIKFHSNYLQFRRAFTSNYRFHHFNLPEQVCNPNELIRIASNSQSFELIHDRSSRISSRTDATLSLCQHQAGDSHTLQTATCSTRSQLTCRCCVALTLDAIARQTVCKSSPFSHRRLSLIIRMAG